MEMNLTLPSVADVEDARRIIAGSAIRTPLVRLNVAGVPEIYLKLENLQPIGSFKIRGASNAMGHLPLETLQRGVLTASAGNMAQGVAWRARELGVACTVIAPETAPETKIAAIQRLGGRVLKVPFEEWWRTIERRSYPGVDGTFIHAFDDLHVMAGNGTIALEVLEDLPDVNAIVIPWGGGGLTCGIAAVMRVLRPDCRIYAAEVSTAAPLAPSLAAGSPQTIPYQPSFVDGIGGKSVFPQMFEWFPGGGAGRGRGGPPPAGGTQSHHRGRRGRLPGSLCAHRPGRRWQNRLCGFGGKHRSGQTMCLVRRPGSCCLIPFPTPPHCV